MLGRRWLTVLGSSLERDRRVVVGWISSTTPPAQL